MEQDGTIRYLDGEIRNEDDIDGLSAVDGGLIETCDMLAAYMEALLSVENGVRPATLVEALDSIVLRYGNRSLAGVSFEELTKALRRSANLDLGHDQEPSHDPEVSL